MLPRLGEARCSRLGSGGLRLAVHRQLCLRNWTSQLDADSRNFPPIDPIEGNVYQCERKLDEQLCYSFHHATHVSRYRFRYLPVLRGMVGVGFRFLLVFCSRDKRQDS